MIESKLAPWRRQVEKHLAESAGEVSARFASLATVRPDRSPAVRSVVFRGFAPESDLMQFTTDARSAKVHEMKAHGMVELCWYSACLRTQWRIAGSVQLCGLSINVAGGLWEDLRLEQWRSISEDARRHFTWPAPGESLADPTCFNAPPPSRDAPLENFILVVLEPYSVDQLELLESPHRRIFYSRGCDGTWSERRLNP